MTSIAKYITFKVPSLSNNVSMKCVELIIPNNEINDYTEKHFLNEAKVFCFEEIFNNSYKTMLNILLCGIQFD